MPTYYIDYVNGNDAADGSTFATGGLPSVGPWKSITTGATAARIAPGDIIKIAKSPDPSDIGVTGTWTDGPLPQLKSIVSSTHDTPITINVTSHGYSDGDIIFVNGHTVNTYANGLFPITGVSTHAFTLVDSVGAGLTGPNTGTVCKYDSAVVELNSSVTQTIDNCDLPWTGSDAAKVTVTNDTADWKEGYSSSKFACGATLGVEKVAYRSFASLDLSGYQQVSFWVKNSVALAAGDFQIKLCSDTAGDTPQNTIDIPAIPSINMWAPFTVNTAGALYNGVQSVALYQAVDKGAMNLWVDNIIACKASASADSLSLTSLISTNSLAQGGTEGWYGIQSIKGRLVVLDNYPSSLPTNIRGWAGTSVTGPTYKRETVKTTLLTSATALGEYLTDVGTMAGGDISYQGGYDVSSGDQNGETFYDGQNGFGYGLYSSRNNIVINRLNFVRYNIGMSFVSLVYQTKVTNIQSLNNNSVCGLCINTASNIIFSNIASICNNRISGISSFSIGSTTSGWSGNHKFVLISNLNNNGVGNVAAGLSLFNTHNCVFDEITLCANNYPIGIDFEGSSLNVIRKVHTKGNNRYSGTLSALEYRAVVHGLTGNNLIINGTFDEGIRGDGQFFIYHGGDDRIYVQNTKYVYGCYAIGNFQTGTKHGSIGAWAFTLTNTTRDINYPFLYKLARFEVHNGVAISAKVWFKKSHATNISAKLVLPGLQVAGIDTDQTATKADDTDWQELEVTGTPSADGIVEIEAMIYCAATSAYVYIDSEMTITS